jgi:hypothetical protein
MTGTGAPTCLISTDYTDTAKSFDSMKAFDNCITLCHPQDTKGKGDGCHYGQTFGNGGDCERYCLKDISAYFRTKCRTHRVRNR